MPPVGHLQPGPTSEWNAQLLNSSVGWIHCWMLPNHPCSTAHKDTCKLQQSRRLVMLLGFTTPLLNVPLRLPGQLYWPARPFPALWFSGKAPASGSLSVCETTPQCLHGLCVGLIYLSHNTWQLVRNTNSQIPFTLTESEIWSGGPEVWVLANAPSDSNTAETTKPTTQRKLIHHLLCSNL